MSAIAAQVSGMDAAGRLDDDARGVSGPSHGSQTSKLTASSKWLDSLSVETKLGVAVLGNTFVFAALIMLILFAAWFFTETGRESAISNAVEARSNNAVIALYQAVESVDMARDNVGNAQSAQALSDANRSIANAVALLDEPIAEAGGVLPQDYAAQYIQLRDDVEALQPKVEAVIFELGSGEIARANASQLDGLKSDIQTSRDGLTAFNASLAETVKLQTTKLFADISYFFIVLAIASGLAIVMSIFGARRVAAGVSIRIKKLTQTMSTIVSGNTTMAIPGRSRNDEIGDMARALEVLRRSSHELAELNQNRAIEVEQQLEQQKQLARQMRVVKREKSQLLEGLAGEFEVSVGELITSVSAASEQLRATSAHMVEVADGSSDQADNASAAMKSASTNITAAAAATDEFALSINEISRQAAASANLARDATDLVSNANTRMTDLSVAADEVGEIAELIQTIAQRTNLLALNASIEAARGGEAGRGFAVVASEVKELAMQTSAATSSVAEKISAMQVSTQSSAGDLNSIYGQIEELEKVAVVIATAVDQQSVSGGELARNIDTVAEGAQQVSELLVELRGASEETGTAAGDVVDSANALGKHADDLREKAGRFISDVRRSARELEADEEAA